MFKLIAVFSLAAAVLFSLPLLAQTQVQGQGGQSITETTEPPPRTIIPEQKAPTAPPRETSGKGYATPHHQPKYEPGPSRQGYHGGSAKCDLPGACDAALPEGAVTLEQLDARRGGAPAQAPTQRYASPPPAPMPPQQYAPPPPAPAPQYTPPAPMPAPAAPSAGPSGYEAPMYESSKDKPVILRHYIPGVSEKMPTYPAPAQPYHSAVPAPAPTPAPVPAPVRPAPVPAPTPAPAPAPAPSYGSVKSDLPGYAPEPLPPGAVRLEDVKSPQSGYVPPPKKAEPAPAPSPAPAYDTAPVRQMDQYEEIPTGAAPDSDLDVQRPASRWKQGR